MSESIHIKSLQNTLKENTAILATVSYRVICLLSLTVMGLLLSLFFEDAFVIISYVLLLVASVCIIEAFKIRSLLNRNDKIKNKLNRLSEK